MKSCGTKAAMWHSLSRASRLDRSATEPPHPRALANGPAAQPEVPIAREPVAPPRNNSPAIAGLAPRYYSEALRRSSDSAMSDHRMGHPWEGSGRVAPAEEGQAPNQARHALVAPHHKNNPARHAARPLQRIETCRRSPHPAVPLLTQARAETAATPRKPRR